MGSCLPEDGMDRIDQIVKKQLEQILVYLGYQSIKDTNYSSVLEYVAHIIDNLCCIYILSSQKIRGRTEAIFGSLLGQGFEYILSSM